VKTATSPMIITSRIQGSPYARRSATRNISVLTHSRAPKTRMICTRRAVQARLKKSRTGNSKAGTTSGISSTRRKCVPSSKALKKTGSNRRKFIIFIYYRIRDISFLTNRTILYFLATRRLSDNRNYEIYTTIYGVYLSR